MFMLPYKSTMKMESFAAVAKELGFKHRDMQKHYKHWLYTWALWFANVNKKDLTIMDAGCGKCTTILKYCADKGATCYGVDMLPRPKVMKGIAKYKQEDITRTSFESDTFDLIFCISVLEHIGGSILLDRYFAEAARILKPGGSLIVTTVDCQKVSFNKPNKALKLKQYYPVPMDYMLIPKVGLTAVPVGLEKKPPRWDDDTLYWRRHGGVDKNKQWTEYCAVFTKDGS
jgi:2-polyprenyl-3-methyl-5-hydroxy-6-metoxy-1,4-benzoquinol methylase